MQSTMTISSSVTLFGVMAVLAFIPGVSVLAVSARSAAYGSVHGVFTALGIVVGDIIFILLAIFGLSMLAQAMGSLFVLIKYLGGVYLIWLGIALWRSKSESGTVAGQMESSLLSSFLTGLFITLGDQKAILFYLGFFPAFLDLSEVSFIDAGIIIFIAALAVGGAKLVYVFIADRAGSFFSSTVNQIINRVAGGVVIAVGVFVIAKA